MEPQRAKNKIPCNQEERKQQKGLSTRLGCFYVSAILSWSLGWGWVEVDIEAEVDLRLRLKWGWVEI